MATRARNAEKIELHDETELMLRPLTIKNLRIFMEKLGQIQAETPDDAEAEEVDELGLLGKFIELARFCINTQSSKEYTTEELEEVIDMPTIQDVMRICAGVELGNQTATTTANPLGRR